MPVCKAVKQSSMRPDPISNAPKFVYKPMPALGEANLIASLNTKQMHDVIDCGSCIGIHNGMGPC